MKLKDLLKILIAKRYVLFDKNGDPIGSYCRRDEIPEGCKEVVVTEIISPYATSRDTIGDIYIGLDF